MGETNKELKELDRMIGVLSRDIGEHERLLRELKRKVLVENEQMRDIEQKIQGARTALKGLEDKRNGIQPVVVADPATTFVDFEDKSIFDSTDKGQGTDNGEKVVKDDYEAASEDED